MPWPSAVGDVVDTPVDTTSARGSPLRWIKELSLRSLLNSRRFMRLSKREMKRLKGRVGGVVTASTRRPIQYGRREEIEHDQDADQMGRRG
jgi:hypothetical protein